MGYTSVSTYSTFNTSPTTINLLRIGDEYLTKSLEKLEKDSIIISLQDMASKLLVRGHCPLHARRRFIGAMVPEAPLDHRGLGLTKPTTFLRLRAP